MTTDELRNAVRILLNDAVKSGLTLDEIFEAVDAELHPDFDFDVAAQTTSEIS